MPVGILIYRLVSWTSIKWNDYASIGLDDVLRKLVINFEWKKERLMSMDDTTYSFEITYWISRVIWDKVNKVRVISGSFTLPVVSDYLTGYQRRLTDEPPVRYASGLVIGH